LDPSFAQQKLSHTSQRLPNADFNLIYTGLSWTDGSMHTLAWQATSSYSSVAIALVDAQNQTVSDFGSYGKLLFTLHSKFSNYNIIITCSC
jgi:hypothetical protein